MDILRRAEWGKHLIHVTPQPEPANFSSLVKRPGDSFLSHTPIPNERQWKSHSYWRQIIPELYKAYSAICAYSCHWIPPDTGSLSVEHFKPKSKYPHLAYRWENYRLVCGTLNGRKGNHEDVLDPFELTDGWFELLFPSLLLVPSPLLTAPDVVRVEMTIKRLKLNDDVACVQARLNWVRAYAIGDITFQHLERRAPFIAYELLRQGIKDNIAEIMRFPHPVRSLGS